MENPFDLRRIGDPQGVIDDLIGQISRQAASIYEQSLLIEKCKALIPPEEFNKLIPKKGKKKHVKSKSS